MLTLVTILVDLLQLQRLSRPDGAYDFIVHIGALRGRLIRETMILILRKASMRLMGILRNLVATILYSDLTSFFG